MPTLDFFADRGIDLEREDTFLFDCSNPRIGSMRQLLGDFYERACGATREKFDVFTETYGAGSSNSLATMDLHSLADVVAAAAEIFPSASGVILNSASSGAGVHIIELTLIPQPTSGEVRPMGEWGTARIVAVEKREVEK